MNQMPQEFRATLAEFAGPLDLLLYLIKKNEIDLLNIPVAEILRQYEQYVKLIKEIDVNIASDYLIMATKLMEIKSRMLLPDDQGGDDADDELEDPRGDLVQQLLEYRTYKEQALHLECRLDETARQFKREETGLPFSLKRIEVKKLSVWDLVASVMRIQEEIEARGPAEIVYTEKPISYYIELIQNSFTGTGAREVLFRDIFLMQETITRNLMVGLFLAVLELVKMGGIGLKRGEKEGQILITLQEDDLLAYFRSLSTHYSTSENEEAADAPEGSGA
jgi:segregation and condensation protein A